MPSPPNFSRKASASTIAIMASPTMPAAGTAQTSLRSTTASTASLVARSTDFSGLGRGIRAADLGALRAARELVPGDAELTDARAADLGDVAQDRDAELRQQALGHAGHGHARGRLAGAGALQHVADVTMAVLHGAGEIGMSGPRPRHFLLRRARLGHRDTHRRLPVLPVAVGDAQRDRRAEGGAPADAGQDVDLIALDLHAPTAAVAALAAGEVAVDVGLSQRQAGRDTVDDGDQCLTVGFARGEEAEDAPHDRLAYRDDAVPVGRLARGASRRSTLGVTKMTSSRFGVVCTRRDLNSQPRTGMSPNTGTLRVLSRSVRCVMPPITSVSPSLTSTSVSARRLLMIGIGAPAPAFPGSPAVLP